MSVVISDSIDGVLGTKQSSLSLSHLLVRTEDAPRLSTMDRNPIALMCTTLFVSPNQFTIFLVDLLDEMLTQELVVFPTRVSSNYTAGSTHEKLSCDE
jgi:hypothetical protein